MQRVDPEEIEPTAMGQDVDRRGLSEPLSTDGVAINRYVLEPGQAFSGGLHTHEDQEELFYVYEGTATFEYQDGPNADGETFEVGPEEGIRFAPGEYQQGRNESDQPVRALAMGAPRESTDVRVPRSCRECGDSDSLRYAMDGHGPPSLSCPECDAEFDLGD